MRPWLLIVAAIVVAAPASAGDLGQYLDRAEALNRNGARAAFAYLHCTESAAKKLAAATEDVPLRLWSIEARAKAVGEMCPADEERLAAAVPATELIRLKEIAQRVNAGTIERMRRGPETMLCAQAEWQGCSMKPIPKWKGVRP